MEPINLDFPLWDRQIQALTTKATECLFGGATEGGKSHLLRVALVTWCLDIPGLQCVLIRKKFDDILKNHVEGPSGFKVLLAPLIERKLVQVTQKEVRFPNGSMIFFQHCQDERQFTSAQGTEKHVLAIDEAPQISERLIRFFRSWCRMDMAMKEKVPEKWQGSFPRILYTGNPMGPSLGFFKRNFVKARDEFAIELVEGFLRQYIPSRVEDNPSVDMVAHYGRLEGLGDRALARALDRGDWDTPLGDFLPEYDETRHVVPDFVPPAHWLRYGGFDWGTAEPFAAYWACVADGSSFSDHRGIVRWFPAGAIIIYREYYGCDKYDPAKGNRMRNEDIAAGILGRCTTADERRMPFLSDSLPHQDRGGPTIAEIMWNKGNGVLLKQGDTGRISGWSQLRSRLIGQNFDTNNPLDIIPMLFICESCKYLRDYLPALQRHPLKPEDAVEGGEATHACDALRYICTARPWIRQAPAPQMDTRNLTNAQTFDDAFKRLQRLKAMQRGSGY